MVGEGVERLVCLLWVVRGGRGEGVGAAVKIGVSGCRMAKKLLGSRDTDQGKQRWLLEN